MESPRQDWRIVQQSRIQERTRRLAYPKVCYFTYNFLLFTSRNKLASPYNGSSAELEKGLNREPCDSELMLLPTIPPCHLLLTIRLYLITSGDRRNVLSYVLMNNIIYINFLMEPLRFIFIVKLLAQSKIILLLLI